MTFRTAFTFIVFTLFVGLCGYELAGLLKANAERDMESVRYVRSIESPEKKQEKAPAFDLNRIMEDTDVNG